MNFSSGVSADAGLAAATAIARTPATEMTERPRVPVPMLTIVQGARKPMHRVYVSSLL